MTFIGEVAIAHTQAALQPRIESNRLQMGVNLVVRPEMVKHQDVMPGINDAPINAFVLSIETHTPGMGPRVQALRLYKGIQETLNERGIPAYSIENETNTNGYHHELPNVIGTICMGNGEDGEQYAARSFHNAVDTYVRAIETILEQNNVSEDQAFRVGFGSVGYEAITSFAVTRALEYWKEEKGYHNLSAVTVNFDSTYHSGQEPKRDITTIDGYEYPLDPCHPDAYSSTDDHTVWQISTNTFSVDVNTLAPFAGNKTVIAAATHPLPQETMQELKDMQFITKATARKTLAAIYAQTPASDAVVETITDANTRLIDIEMNNEYFTGTQGQRRKFLTPEQIEDVAIGADKLIKSFVQTGQLFSKNELKTGNDLETTILVLAPEQCLELLKKHEGVVEQDGLYWLPEQDNVRFTLRQRMPPDEMKTLFRASDLVLTRSSQMNTTLEAGLVTPILVDTMPGFSFMHSDLADQQYASEGASFRSSTQVEDLTTAIAYMIAHESENAYFRQRQTDYIDTQHSTDSGVDFYQVVKYAFGLAA